MQFSHINPGMKLALGIYAGARLWDLLRGGRWNGGQQELVALTRTLPRLSDSCDRLLAVAQELRGVLLPTITPERSRRRNRRVTKRRRVVLRRTRSRTAAATTTTAAPVRER